ncbi:MAG: ABC transporter ATP-binding protein, partial [Proteobacteria bacterium]|nr:ABC transporter ATP-binding protein [Pseudomonadota bacterium]
RVVEYVGGYDDWLRQRPKPPTEKEKQARAAAQCKPIPKPDAPRKLTFKEQQEKKQLAKEQRELPLRIEKLEQELEALHQRMAKPDFYKGTRNEIAAATDRLEALEAELEQTFERWEAAESRLAELTTLD